MTGGIASRWEWRTFGGRFGEAESRFAAIAPERVQESDELYLPSLKSYASVKIREGLIDVKLLERVNDDGLEQWQPAIKAAFPLPAAQVLAVMEALGIVTAPLARAAFTHDQLLDELVSPSADLSAVRLHKQRAHYTIAGCMAELSEMSETATDGTSTAAAISLRDAGTRARTRPSGSSRSAWEACGRGARDTYRCGSARQPAVPRGLPTSKRPEWP